MNYHALIRDLAVITFATVVPALALYGLLFAASVAMRGCT